MRFAFDETQRNLITAVDEVVAECRGSWSDDRDPRVPLAALGRRRLLAVHWPEALGGRGLRFCDFAAVCERIGHHGLADVLHLVSIQAVGGALLLAGTRQQRELAGRLARGESFGSLLFSEREAGSDFAGIHTTARSVDGGFEVHGEKTWSMYAPWCDVALCSARTSEGGSPYEGLSLLLVPLDVDTVAVDPLPGPSNLYRVVFDGLRVERAALVGEEGNAWPLMLRIIALERAGFDYLSRARRWLDAAATLTESLDDPLRTSARVELVRLEAEWATARLLAYMAVASFDGDEMDEFHCAESKVAASEAAQHIAWWAAETLPMYGETDEARLLRAAVAEAPGLTVSGGATEALLDGLAAEVCATVGAS